MKIKQKDINFYSVYRNSNTKNIKNHEITVLASIVGVSLILAVSSAIFFRVRTINIEKDIKTVTDEINSIFADEKFSEMGEIQSQVNELSEKSADVQKADEYIRNSSEIPSELLERISKSRYADINSYVYSSEKNSLTVEGYADSASDISEFISELRKSGECSDIEYTGYTSVSDGVKFSAVCIFETKGVVTESEY